MFRRWLRVSASLIGQALKTEATVCRGQRAACSSPFFLLGRTGRRGEGGASEIDWRHYTTPVLDRWTSAQEMAALMRPIESLEQCTPSWPSLFKVIDHVVEAPLSSFVLCHTQLSISASVKEWTALFLRTGDGKFKTHPPAAAATEILARKTLPTQIGQKCCRQLRTTEIAGRQTQKHGDEPRPRAAGELRCSMASGAAAGGAVCRFDKYFAFFFLLMMCRVLMHLALA